jgi:uncharacterized protein
MIDLKKRLARLESSQKESAPKTAAIPKDIRLPSHLGFRKKKTESGTAWIRERRVDEAGFPSQLTAANLNSLFTRQAPADLSVGDLLFLDVETTGLAGGTGTLAFLVGLLWHDGKRGIRLRQYFLPSPGCEGAMLGDLHRLVARFKVILTYNGNCFDLPLLRTRGILSRIRSIFGETISWDLLPAVRRLWGRTLDDCRQQTLEADLSGKSRGEGDIDGHLIPQIWLDFVRSGSLDGLPETITHNDRDMVGMLHIFNAVIERLLVYDRMNDSDAVRWSEAWALAAHAERRRDPDREAYWIKTALATTGRIRPPERFWRDALRLSKRFANHEQIAALLQRINGSTGKAAWLNRENAIFLEHRRHDPVAALAYAERLEEPRRIERLEDKIKALKNPEVRG